MKREKDEKIMGPMFPRLHVNDTDKGGPKAPPRNKMALYEQLSIPSNRFTHADASLVHPSSQGVTNERDMFFSYNLPTRPQSEKQHTEHPDPKTPVRRIEQRKNSDDDDFTVPIFIHSVPNSQECLEYGNFNHQLKCQKSKKSSVLENSVKQEGQSREDETSEKIATDRTQPISTSPTIEKDKYKLDSKYNTSVSEKNVAALENKTEFQDRSCGLQNTRNLESVDSLSENSVVDSVSGVDITPHDVVGVIGQKHFWKARREIMNQQRIFAIQVFELHRLIQVQKLIAASPHLLLEDSSFSTEPIKASPGKRKLLNNNPFIEIPCVSKQKGETEKPMICKNRSSIENAAEKEASFAPPSNLRPVIGNNPSPSISSECNSGPWGFNQPLLGGNHWLIPVMSSSEGMVYKPYPVPGFVGPACGGCGPPGSYPLVGSFPAPSYGIPAPQILSFPRAGAYGYFQPYGVPITNIAGFSGSSAKQTRPDQILAHDPDLSAIPGHRTRASPDVLDDLHGSDNSEAQRFKDNGEHKYVEERNAHALSLFPVLSATDGPRLSPKPLEPERPTQVIKAVPHNARSASESAARIFQAIQEGRQQYSGPGPYKGRGQVDVV
ncbi:Protein EARLY FLOWERING [Orobanche gracilis]